MNKESSNWKSPRFFFFAFIVCLVTGAYPFQGIDFNLKLLSMILLIFVTYYMVIEYKKMGAIFVSFFYVIGFVVVAIITKFDDYHTNAVMAFQIATLISIYYLYDYVRKNEIANKRLYENSICDDLTNIYNQRYYRIKADEVMARAKRYDLKFAVVLLDVDHFKSFNDTYGHLFGDEILKLVAAEVKKSIRTEDTFCRYGGDEFIILISNYSELARERISERIGTSIQRVNEQIYEELKAPVSISLGFGIYPDQARTLDELFRIADKEMYKAKTHADQESGEAYRVEAGISANQSC